MMLATKFMFGVFAFEQPRTCGTELSIRQFGWQIWWLEFCFCKWICRELGRVWSMIFGMACLCVVVLSCK